MEKEIRIFDTSNNVLPAPGINFQLLDASTGTIVASDTSKDLNPPYNEWGVKLTFSASAGPFQVYTNDPTYKYPGNVIESLEGTKDNRINIDLLKIPAYGSGQAQLSGPTTVMQVIEWIRAAKDWKPEDKRAVLNLFANYIKLRGQFKNAMKQPPLSEVAANWETALKKLGIPYDDLQ
ncbi:hypothetical protein [Afipia sp. GAS231]|uniref:hypothetical protein n=1 Tax=Afipia sp. GAS231 TaxID=1882747 RepID=UPI00087D05EF|nr:hypothetical protein [Afipia sp. GAS231]SDP04553.1 hypothetical protein SAMN05444050_5690 [Afipia sp. GAS231]